jgi:hypothetical protein
VADLKPESQRRKWSTFPRAAAPNKAAALHNEPSHFTVWRLLFNALTLTGTESVCLKEHRASVEEQRKVEELENTVTQQQKKIEALTAGLQKVSAQLAASD